MWSKVVRAVATLLGSLMVLAGVVAFSAASGWGIGRWSPAVGWLTVGGLLLIYGVTGRQPPGCK